MPYGQFKDVFRASGTVDLRYRCTTESSTGCELYAGMAVKTCVLIQSLNRNYVLAG